MRGRRGQGKRSGVAADGGVCVCGRGAKSGSEKRSDSIEASEKRSEAKGKQIHKQRTTFTTAETTATEMQAQTTAALKQASRMMTLAMDRER